MAAYAALVSLMNTMKNIHNHPRFSSSLDEKQAESLREKLDFLLDFVERYNSHGDGGISKEEVEDLESQIASAAHAAEDVIESHVVDQILARSTEKSPSFLIDLQKIIEAMDSIKEMVKEEKGFKGQQPRHSMPAASSGPLPSTGKAAAMVGFEDYLKQLLAELTGSESARQIIPIVGMAGIGKTTLAKNVYEHSLTVQHFHIRAWVTVSQDYSVRKFLLEILSCLREPKGEMDKKPEHELSDQLHKVLSGKRYLIILDDVWSIEVWNDMKFLFPDNYNRSRIVVTTRLFDVANHFGSSKLVVDFLNEDESWKLFCQKAFAQEHCPPKLEEIGKRIVEKCKGLPLSIVVIGGLLQKSLNTQEHWEYVAKDIISILNSEENQCLDILFLSYSHLPACLKPCFLYMGIFPEDHEIHVSRLVKLWVAEGFLKPNEGQSLEEVAEGYIKELVDRNLVLVRSLGSNGKFKTCNIHDLLRDLCIKVVGKEKFLCATTVLKSPRDIDREHHILNEGSTEYYYPRVSHALESTSPARSQMCKSPTLSLSKSRLLRVLSEARGDSLDATFQKVNLRFLACESIRASINWICTYKLPSSISLLWNVQTLIIDKIIDEVVAPSEIWEMPQLRHVQFHRICLPDPPPSDEQDDFVLRNLQTLGTVLDFRCSEEVCRRIPNIEKLRVFYDDFSGKGETSLRYGLYNVECFHRLESLYYCFYTVPNRDDLLKSLKFPSSLKRLTLKYCELHWNDLTIIGSLPHLEVLKLKYQSVRGPKWDVEGEFRSLKFLEIDSCYLIYWYADKSHFPVLEKLVLRGLHKLDEIPSGIGEIMTLEGICVVDCSISATISAIKILDGQESFGNYHLKVQVEFWNKIEVEEFEVKVKMEEFTCQNFQIVGV